MIQDYLEWQKDQIGYLILAGVFGYQYGYTDSRFYLFVIAWVISLIICRGYSIYLTMKMDFDFSKEYRSKVWIQAISVLLSYMGLTQLVWY